MWLPRVKKWRPFSGCCMPTSWESLVRLDGKGERADGWIAIILLMDKILHHHGSKDDDYPLISRVLTIPGGAGFCPSTVALMFGYSMGGQITGIFFLRWWVSIGMMPKDILDIFLDLRVDQRYVFGGWKWENILISSALVNHFLIEYQRHKWQQREHNQI